MAATCQVGGGKGNYLRPLLENRGSFDSDISCGTQLGSPSERGGRLDGVLTKNRGSFDKTVSGGNDLLRRGWINNPRGYL